MTLPTYSPSYVSRRIDYSRWGICGYRHCAKPLRPGLKFCGTENGLRPCYQSERYEQGKARGVLS